MNRPAVHSLLAQLPDNLRGTLTTLVVDMPEATAVDAIRAAWPAVKADLADVARRVEQHRAAQDAGHRGGVKTAQKRLLGLLPAVDPAGKLWKPDHTSALDKTIFPKWGRIPVYIPALAQDMNRVMLATAVLIGEVVDRKGRFKLARATHAGKAGCSEGKAYAALKTYEAAGLIEVDIPGNQDQATIWRYRPVAKVDIAHARRVIQAARKTQSSQAKKRFAVDQPAPIRDRP